MAKCYTCEKGNLIKKKVDYDLHGESLGEFEAEVCDKCGEKFFSEETSDKITAMAKKKGLFGLEAKTKIGQAGTTLDIRLPQKIMPESINKLVVTV